MAHNGRSKSSILLKVVPLLRPIALLLNLIVTFAYGHVHGPEISNKDVSADVKLTQPLLNHQVETGANITETDRKKLELKYYYSGKVPLIKVLAKIANQPSEHIVSYPGFETGKKGANIRRSKSVLDINSASAGASRDSSRRNSISVGSHFCGPDSAVSGATFNGILKSMEVPVITPVDGSMSIDSTASMGLLPGFGDELDNFMRMVLPGITDEMIEALKNSSLGFIRAYRIQLPLFQSRNGVAVNLAAMGDAVQMLGRMQRHGGEELSDAQRQLASQHLIRNTNLFQFIAEIRRAIAGGDTQNQGISGLRTEPYIVQGDNNEPILAMELETEVGMAQEAIQNGARRMGLRRDTERLLNTRNVDGNNWHLVSLPPSGPELINFPLEVILNYLFQEMAKVSSFPEFIDALARFSVLFNLIRPFQYCNEMTLANTLSFILMLYQGPTFHQTCHQNQFHFPSLESLSTVSLDRMRGVLYDGLRMVTPFAQPAGTPTDEQHPLSGRQNEERLVGGHIQGESPPVDEVIEEEFEGTL